MPHHPRDEENAYRQGTGKEENGQTNQAKNRYNIQRAPQFSRADDPGDYCQDDQSEHIVDHGNSQYNLCLFRLKLMEVLEDSRSYSHARCTKDRSHKKVDIVQAKARDCREELRRELLYENPAGCKSEKKRCRHAKRSARNRIEKMLT